MFPWKVARKPNAHKKIVLVVDGERTFRHFALRLVQRLGCTAIGLRDAEECERWLDAAPHAPSLIIVDASLRLMNGFVLCEMIRIHDKSASCPVLFASSRVALDDNLRAVQAGADAFLAKPVHPDLFQGTIERLLRAGRHVDAAQPAWAEDVHV